MRLRRFVLSGDGVLLFTLTRPGTPWKLACRRGQLYFHLHVDGREKDLFVPMPGDQSR